MRTVLIIAFLTFSHLSNAQLIDPFGKMVVHEIKLSKLDNGSYMGAMEWTTGGIDSLQRFVVKGLSVKAPVMVRVISKAPDHNIDLSFHKSGWDEVESKISTNGDKFADKVFRTMNKAGIGVSSKVAGIPYLIIVKVGLQFPSTKSLIRITDDLEEYNRHLTKMGITTVGNKNNNINVSTPIVQGDNSTFMYVIISLLGLIIVLLLLFLIKKKKSKSALLLFLAFGCISNVIAQNEPKWVPIDGQGESPVFYEYRTANVTNQKPVQITNPRVRDASVDAGIGDSGVFRTSSHIRIESNPDSRELSREEIEELTRQMHERDEQFDSHYRENMPGEPTDSDQRTLPVDRTQEELEQLRMQVRRLQRQVDLLSQEDEQYEDEENEGTAEEILIFCEQCQDCMDSKTLKFIKYYGYVQYLQNYYKSEITSINDQIAHGNSIASIPGAGLGWGNILLHIIRPAVDQLNAAYSDKFDEYMRSMETIIGEIIACTATSTNQEQLNHTLAVQSELMGLLNNLKATKINL